MAKIASLHVQLLDIDMIKMARDVKQFMLVLGTTITTRVRLTAIKCARGKNWKNISHVVQTAFVTYQKHVLLDSFLN